MSTKIMNEGFVRKRKYTRAIEDVKDFIAHYGNEILPVPNANTIICYYQGKPVVEIGDRSWKFFPGAYNDYLPEDVLKEKKQCKGNSKKEFYRKHKDDILKAIEKGLPNDKERFSEQYIILQALNYEKEGFIFCGMETAIPSGVLRKKGEDSANSEVPDENKAAKKKKPEIDIVAFDPKTRTLLLIEYKCQKKALLNSKANIRRHAEDYHKIKEWIEEDKERTFVRGMLNAYKVLCDIYGRPYDESELDAGEYHVEIVFLLTNRPHKDKPSSAEQILTKRAYETAKKHLKETGIAGKAFYLAYDKPEDIESWPHDMEQYRGIDKLVWKEEWNA